MIDYFGFVHVSDGKLSEKELCQLVFVGFEHELLRIMHVSDKYIPVFEQNMHVSDKNRHVFVGNMDTLNKNKHALLNCSIAFTKCHSINFLVLIF